MRLLTCSRLSWDVSPCSPGMSGEDAIVSSAIHQGFRSETNPILRLIPTYLLICISDPLISGVKSEVEHVLTSLCSPACFQLVSDDAWTTERQSRCFWHTRTTMKDRDVSKTVYHVAEYGEPTESRNSSTACSGNHCFALPRSSRMVAFVLTLFTFCPPGPDDLEYVSS